MSWVLPVQGKEVGKVKDQWSIGEPTGEKEPGTSTLVCCQWKHDWSVENWVCYGRPRKVVVAGSRESEWMGAASAALELERIRNRGVGAQEPQSTKVIQSWDSEEELQVAALKLVWQSRPRRWLGDKGSGISETQAR